MWHNLLHICACVLQYTKFASFTFDYHVHIEVACHEAHRFPYPLNIPPKVTSHVIFWAAKMVNTKCSEKRVVTSTHLFFSIWHSVWLRGMNSTFLWYEWVCVRLGPSLFTSRSVIYIFYTIFQKKNISTHTLESNAIYIGRISIRKVSCHLHVTLFAVTCHFYFASTLWLHTCVCFFVSFSLFFCVSLPIDLFDLLSKVLLVCRCCWFHLTH